MRSELCQSQVKSPAGSPAQPTAGTKRSTSSHPKPGMRKSEELCKYQARCRFGSSCWFKHLNPKTARRRRQRRRKEQAKSASLDADKSPAAPSASPADGSKKGSKKTVKRRHQRRRKIAREREGLRSASSADPVGPPTKLVMSNTASPVGAPNRKRARVGSPCTPPTSLNPSAAEWLPSGFPISTLPTTPVPQSDPSMTDEQAQPPPQCGSTAPLWVAAPQPSTMGAGHPLPPSDDTPVDRGIPLPL